MGLCMCLWASVGFSGLPSDVHAPDRHMLVRKPMSQFSSMYVDAFAGASSEWSRISPMSALWAASRWLTDNDALILTMEDDLSSDAGVEPAARLWSWMHARLSPIDAHAAYWRPKRPTGQASTTRVNVHPHKSTIGEETMKRLRPHLNADMILYDVIRRSQFDVVQRISKHAQNTTASIPYVQNATNPIPAERARVQQQAYLPEFYYYPPGAKPRDWERMSGSSRESRLNKEQQDAIKYTRLRWWNDSAGIKAQAVQNCR